MQYFMIVFAAFNIILGTYIYLLQSDNDNLRSENTDIKIMLESQKKELSKEKLEYLEKVEKSKNQTLDKLILDKSSCETELDSYKRLIRAL